MDLESTHNEHTYLCDEFQAHDTSLAYSEAHPDEKPITCPALLRRATADFAGRGILAIERVLTDNAYSYRLAPSPGRSGINGKRPRPYRPQINSKAEHCNRILFNERTNIRACIR
ncbi:hypothetical protein DP939_22520 [Spongiactinospora rosea]|uniref:Transposase n=1 Tax=Spongiactinospora rosea TaxID=2248750 RepID=A0A366LWJ4_9ACTN|nr:hypothetical protein DP939_22520 [Spongiactinospora rosea]